MKQDVKDLLILISYYNDRLKHILEYGDKRYIRKNLIILINYMEEDLNEILVKYNYLESKGE